MSGDAAQDFICATNDFAARRVYLTIRMRVHGFALPSGSFISKCLEWLDARSSPRRQVCRRTGYHNESHCG